MKHWLILLSLFFSLPLWAEKKGKIVETGATYTMEIPSYMSFAQACREGLTKARNEAIDNVFHSNVGSGTEIEIRNENGSSDISLRSIVRSTVRGIWLGDVDKPKYERKISEDGRDFLDITVKGKVRELVTAGVPLEVLPLRVKPDKQLGTNKFRHGDDFFLYFKSPIDGYLTVFLFDTTTDEVCYMLPYHSSGTGSYRINHNEEYIFFSPETAKANDGDIDELVMTCSKRGVEEYDELYIVFSPNKYSKANSNIGQQKIDEGLILPERMDYMGFNSWLMKYQQKDEDMQVIRIPVQITDK